MRLKIIIIARVRYQHLTHFCVINLVFKIGLAMRDTRMKRLDNFLELTGTVEASLFHSVALNKFAVLSASFRQPGEQIHRLSLYNSHKIMFLISVSYNQTGFEVF